MIVQTVIPVSSQGLCAAACYAAVSCNAADTEAHAMFGLPDVLTEDQHSQGMHGLVIHFQQPQRLCRQSQSVAIFILLYAISSGMLLPNVLLRMILTVLFLHIAFGCDSVVAACMPEVSSLIFAVLLLQLPLHSISWCAKCKVLSKHMMLGS